MRKDRNRQRTQNDTCTWVTEFPGEESSSEMVVNDNRFFLTGERLDSVNSKSPISCEIEKT